MTRADKLNAVAIAVFAVVLLLLSQLMSGCASGAWHERGRQGLATAVLVADAVHDVAGGSSFCAPVVTYCRAKKLSSDECTALRDCQLAQHDVLRGLVLLGEAIKVTDSGLKLAGKVEGATRK